MGHYISGGELFFALTPQMERWPVDWEVELIGEFDLSHDTIGVPWGKCWQRSRWASVFVPGIMLMVDKDCARKVDVIRRGRSGWPRGLIRSTDGGKQTSLNREESSWEWWASTSASAVVVGDYVGVGVVAVLKKNLARRNSSMLDTENFSRDTASKDEVRVVFKFRASFQTYTTFIEYVLDPSLIYICLHGSRAVNT